MIITPPGKLFSEVIDGLKEEMSDEFSITVLEKPKKDGTQDIERYFKSTTPKVVVIIGNRLLKVYAAYRERNPAVSGIPVVSVYALDTKRAISKCRHGIGISCQTPMVTALVHFRGITSNPVKKVGVIYRAAFEEFIEKHTRLCKREKITVKSIMIGNDQKKHKKEIKNALKQLVVKEKVDAFWIPNDNVILKSDLLGNVWLPFFNKHDIPVIVGVEVLVKPELDFGAFAVVPDAKGMGVQAANIIYDLMDEDWKVDGVKVYPTLSVYSVLNYKKAKKQSDRLDLRQVKKVLGR